MLGPKASGAWHLQILGTDLELFVLFSSVSATIGAGLGRGSDMFRNELQKTYTYIKIQ